MEDKIRDLRTKQKFVVDDVYIDKYAKHCGIYATGVYFCLCRHADKKQTCFPGKKLVAEEVAISERQVSNCLEPLQRFNIIQVNSSWRSHGKSGKYSSNTYTLMDSSVWKPVFELKNNGNRKHDMPTAEHADGIICRSPTAHHDISRRHMVPTKETHTKETHTKETQYIAAHEIFDHWNNKKIIIHNKAEPFVSVINSAIKNYGVAPIKAAIDNYSLILADKDKYWLKHRWTLKQFLIQTNAIDKFLSLNFDVKDYIKREIKKNIKPWLKNDEDIVDKYAGIGIVMS